MKFENLTERIIGSFYDVYNELGYGFLESIYQKALASEFDDVDLRYRTELPINVVYSGEIIGEFYVDFLVQDKVILELKAVKTLKNEHEAQLLNYLNASQFEVGILFNFGPNPEIKRKILDNDQKTYSPHE
jgi:GxxExxY protein